MFAKLAIVSEFKLLLYFYKYIKMAVILKQRLQNKCVCFLIINVHDIPRMNSVLLLFSEVDSESGYSDIRDDITASIRDDIDKVDFDLPEDNVV